MIGWTGNATSSWLFKHTWGWYMLKHFVLWRGIRMFFKKNLCSSFKGNAKPLIMLKIHTNNYSIIILIIIILTIVTLIIIHHMSQYYWKCCHLPSKDFEKFCYATVVLSFINKSIENVVDLLAYKCSKIQKFAIDPVKNSL